MNFPQTAHAEPERSRRPDFVKGYVAIFTTVLTWSTPSLFLFYLNRFYDPYAQNFYRYAIASLAVAPFCFWRASTKGRHINSRIFFACCLPAIPNVIHQVSQVLALSYIGPGVFAIFMRTSVIMTAILALILFPEERWILRQWQFQTGTVVGLLGAIGVFWFQPGLETGHVPLRGFAITFVAAFSWALYGALVKRPSGELGPVRSFGVISGITAIILFFLTLVFGDITTPAHVSSHVNFVMIISAVTCISLAHVLYYVAIRELGVALAQTLQLLCPLGALALSFAIFGEQLSPAQLASAAVLLVGAFLAMHVKPPPAPESAENL